LARLVATSKFLQMSVFPNMYLKALSYLVA
jgi:hypothetical protein